MVDENLLGRLSAFSWCLVQIPLWSMKTPVATSQRMHSLKVQIPLWSMKTGRRQTQAVSGTRFRFLYGRWKLQQCLWNPNRRLVQIPLWSMKTGSSSRRECSRSHVQIPLWSMKTMMQFAMFPWYSCSDSSMVDENKSSATKSTANIPVQIPLWSMKTRQNYPNAVTISSVQIPLWSMKTTGTLRRSGTVTVFRFLYGRWKLWQSDPADRDIHVQIPLWSMKTNRFKVV